MKYFMVILICFTCSCSQSPSSNNSQTGQVAGKIVWNTNSAVELDGIQIRAYQFKSNQWQNNPPVNSTFLKKDGSYDMHLPDGEYIFSLFINNQNGPEFYYTISDRMPCKNYEVRLRNIENDEIVSSIDLVCNPETVRIHNNELTSQVNFDIQNTGDIIGQITNPEGTPLSRVTITVLYEGDQYAQTTTDEKGKYTICCLPEGDYHILAEANNMKYVSKYFNRANYIQDASDISVVAENPSDHTDIQLSIGGRITGKIFDHDHLQPVSNIVVTAFDRSLNRKAGRSIPSDTEGNYTIYGLPPAEYVLHADAYNTEYVSCFYKSSDSINDANTLDLSTGGNLYDKDFDLKQPGTIIATLVEDDTHNPIEDDRIYAKIYSASTDELIKMVSSERGVIKADKLFAGKYKFEIITDGTRFAPVIYSHRKTLEDAWKVQIFNGQTKDDLLFELHTGGSISGRVVEEQNGTVLYDYTVRGVSKINPMWICETKTNVDGEYTLKGLIEDSYIVQVLTGDMSYISEYYQNQYAQQNAVPIDVQYNLTQPDINFSLEKGGTIYGDVTCNQTGNPVSGITIYATNTIGYTYSAQTNLQGTYVIYGIPTGFQYSLYADASGTEYLSEYYPDKLLENEAVPIRVDDLVTGVNIDFSLSKKPEVSGTITCPSYHKLTYCLDNLFPGNFVIEIWDNTEINNPIKTSAEFDLSPNQLLDDMDFDL